jgi:hypothetical protein
MSLHTFGQSFGTDKATYHNFTTFYDMVLAGKKDKIMSMIEYGVAGDASLKMWQSYFSPQTTIYAFDIDLRGDPKLPNVHCIYANQDSQESLLAGLYGIGSVDLIVEDGGHFSTQQRNTLAVSWSHLNSGGYYILEDLHTNLSHWYPNHKYWNESPTMYEDIANASLGKPNGLPIPSSEIHQIMLFTQPSTTSMTCILVKK